MSSPVLFTLAVNGVMYQETDISGTANFLQTTESLILDWSMTVVLGEAKAPFQTVRNGFSEYFSRVGIQTKITRANTFMVALVTAVRILAMVI